LHACSGTGFGMNWFCMTCNMLFFSLCFYCCFCTHIITLILWKQVARFIFDFISMNENIIIIVIRRVWRYQSGNQNQYIEEEQTTQWPKDRQHNGQKTDNTVAKRQTTQWPKDRQHNGQKTDNTMAKKQTTQWPKDRQHNGQK